MFEKMGAVGTGLLKEVRKAQNRYLSLSAVFTTLQHYSVYYGRYRLQYEKVPRIGTYLPTEFYQHLFMVCLYEE